MIVPLTIRTYLDDDVSSLSFADHAMLSFTRGRKLHPTARRFPLLASVDERLLVKTDGKKGLFTENFAVLC